MQAKAFSLIELLVVISIVALLGMAMFPNFVSIQHTAKTISAKATARAIMVALEQYYFAHQSYPNGRRIPIVTILPILVDGQWLSSFPLNPFTGKPYALTDEKGKLIYSQDDVKGYRLTGYGADNTTIIFDY